MADHLAEAIGRAALAQTPDFMHLSVVPTCFDAEAFGWIRLDFPKPPDTPRHRDRVLRARAILQPLLRHGG